MWKRASCLENAIPELDVPVESPAAYDLETDLAEAVGIGRNTASFTG
jgi:hypothetical protein